jgi:hypothetical protein
MGAVEIKLPRVSDVAPAVAAAQVTERHPR